MSRLLFAFVIEIILFGACGTQKECPCYSYTEIDNGLLAIKSEEISHNPESTLISTNFNHIKINKR